MSGATFSGRLNWHFFPQKRPPETENERLGDGRERLKKNRGVEYDVLICGTSSLLIHFMEGEIAPNVPFNEAYRKRTKEASLRIIRLFQHLPCTGEAGILGKQLLRSATSVAANFRAACRGRSPAEWYAKLCICVEEADETLFWLELIGDAGIIPKNRLHGLEQEYTEILSVLATARKKAKRQ